MEKVILGDQIQPLVGKVSARLRTSNRLRRRRRVHSRRENGRNLRIVGPPAAGRRLIKRRHYGCKLVLLPMMAYVKREGDGIVRRWEGNVGREREEGPVIKTGMSGM